jgi:hypothetical protein
MLYDQYMTAVARLRDSLARKLNLTPRKRGAATPPVPPAPRREPDVGGAALNSRHLALPPRAIRSLQRLKGDTQELEAVWRDLLAMLWFLDPQPERSCPPP